MNYKEILENIAVKNNTTPEEVDSEMRKALKFSELDIEPSAFIAFATAKAKKTIYRN